MYGRWGCECGVFRHFQEDGRLLVGDSIYDSGDNYQLLGTKKIKPYISFNRRNRRTWQGFTFNKKKDCLTCPQGKVSIGKDHQEDGFLY